MQIDKTKHEVEAILAEKLKEVADKEEEIQAQADILIMHKRELELKQEALAQQNQKLKAAYRKLKELDRFKEALTSMIVHDLKNPLNTVLNLAEKNSSIERAGKKMLNLVLSILDIRKFEEAEIKLHLEVIELSKLAEKAIQEVKYLLIEKNIAINIDIKQAISVDADIDVLLRVVVNLLTNAIKYTPNNGKILLSGEFSHEENMACFKVIDTGEGIPEKQIHKIFTKFGQVKTRKSGKIRSTGLGLTFCKMAIEAHQGIIGVETVSGKGSTFWFKLQGVSQETDTTGSQVIQKTFNEAVVLDQEDKNFLKKYYPKIKTIDVYEYSEMHKVLEDIMKHNKSLNIEKWKNEMENAIHTCNESKYEYLVTQLI